MVNDKRPSGRFVLRIEPGLHAMLREAAEASGVSLNEYCARKLAAPGPLPEAAAIETVQAAARLAGERLVGLAVFGSWARAEAGPDSDVDLLVVLEPTAAITRDLYRRWDAAPPRWNGLEIEPHFVALAAPERRVSGVWAEAAVDGLVLFDRDLAFSRRLALVRRDIASGRLRRRVANGQPYWVGAA